MYKALTISNANCALSCSHDDAFMEIIFGQNAYYPVLEFKFSTGKTKLMIERTFHAGGFIGLKMVIKARDEKGPILTLAQRQGVDILDCSYQATQNDKAVLDRFPLENGVLQTVFNFFCPISGTTYYHMWHDL